jgi:hypothetical protein
MKANCSCDSHAITSHSFLTNAAFTPKYIEYEGRDTIIVPIVLLRQTVVNDVYIDKSELVPQSWDGVPVTLNHPAKDGQFVSANQPDILTKYCIGRIFNSKLKGDKLTGEAWLDVEKVNAIMPELITMIEAGKNIDVSTGYFCSDERAKGTYAGKSYNVKSHDLKPNHLAILPNEEGACNWADGCGIRANEGNTMAKDKDNETSFFEMLKERLGLNRRGSDFNPQQMVADLISSDKTPFGPDNTYALQQLDTEALMGLCNQFGLRSNTTLQTNGANEVKKPNVAELVAAGYDKDTAELMVNAASGETKKTVVVNEAKPVTAADIATLIKDNNAELLKSIPQLVTNTLAEQRKPELLEKVVANTTYTKEQADKMTVEQLELIANSIKPVVATRSNVFAGRGTAVSTNATDKEAKEASAKIATNMLPPKIDWKAAGEKGKVH